MATVKALPASRAMAGCPELAAPELSRRHAGVFLEHGVEF
jgi:hypothetical protein